MDDWCEEVSMTQPIGIGLKWRSRAKLITRQSWSCFFSENYLTLRDMFKLILPPPGIRTAFRKWDAFAKRTHNKFSETQKTQSKVCSSSTSSRTLFARRKMAMNGMPERLPRSSRRVDLLFRYHIGKTLRSLAIATINHRGFRNFSAVLCCFPMMDVVRGRRRVLLPHLGAFLFATR